MSRLTRSFTLLTVLLLVACNGAANTEPSPVPPTLEPTEPATATLPPPPSPTATAVPPTATPTEVPPTATALPPTPTPEPTATPTPGPGSVIFAASFEQLDGWSEFAVPDSSRFSFETRNDRLHAEVDGEGLTAYLVYDTDLGYADVQIDADVETIAGPNRNNISLLCRSTDEGWYEFSMYSGGLWEIWKYVDGGYISLASGGSTAIHMQKAKNHLTAVCQDTKLTLYINDVEVGSAVDRQFTEGQVGLSASTFDISGVVVEFDDFTVTLPDPANPPGLAVAPTVPPSSAGSDDGGQPGTVSLPTVPVAGQTLADAQLQQDILSFVLLYETAASPSCQNRQITNTEVTGVTQDFRFENNILVAGEWSERWTINSCGAVTAYHVDYQADGSGGVFFSIGPA